MRPGVSQRAFQSNAFQSKGRQTGAQHALHAGFALPPHVERGHVSDSHATARKPDVTDVGRLVACGRPLHHRRAHEAFAKGEETALCGCRCENGGRYREGSSTLG